MWLVFLDEFGHEGYYERRSDPRFGQSPVFGLGGFMIKPENAYEAVVRYNYLKAKYHGEKFRRPEVKGQKAFQPNIEKLNSNARKNVRDKGYALLKLLDDAEAQVVYFGLEKYSPSRKAHEPRKVHLSCVRRGIDRLNKVCRAENSRFILFFDQHEYHNEKMDIVERIASEKAPNRNRIANLPYDLDSNIHSCIQISDWICSLMGKTFAYEVDSKQWASNKWYYGAFHEKILELSSPASRFNERQRKLAI